MRQDMAKLICERPRYLIRYGGSTRGRASADLENLPRQESLRKAHHKSCRLKQLNDYLAPLRRYPLKQAGRPWDKVHSEICNCPGGRALNIHLRAHVHDFVAIEGRDGRPLFVDPRTGILRRNQGRHR